MLRSLYLFLLLTLSSPAWAFDASSIFQTDTEFAEHLPGEWRLYDLEGLQSIYHFRDDNRLDKVEYFDEEQKTLLLTEHMIWKGDWCIARGWSTPTSGIELVQYFSKKNNQGFVSSWFQKTDSPCDELPGDVGELMGCGKKLFPLEEEASYWERFSGLLSDVRTQFSYEPQMAELIEDFLQDTCGEQYLAFAGWFPQPSKIGVVGDREVSKKARVTFINGILNREALCHQSGEILSQLHGGQKIHYLYMASGGWSQDLAKAYLSKNGFDIPEAKMLATLWKKLIHDAGGPQRDLTIVHYAHSQGVVVTRQAVKWLTPEERAVLRIYCVASPSFILDEEYKDFQQYVSRTDFVVAFTSSVLDPASLARAMMTNHANVEFVGSLLDLPRVEHQINQPSYIKVLGELGHKFLEEFDNGE